jgi:hypothetical protein
MSEYLANLKCLSVCLSCLSVCLSSLGLGLVYCFRPLQLCMLTVSGSHLGRDCHCVVGYLLLRAEPERITDNIVSYLTGRKPKITTAKISSIE